MYETNHGGEFELLYELPTSQPLANRPGEVSFGFTTGVEQRLAGFHPEPTLPAVRRCAGDSITMRGMFATKSRGAVQPLAGQ